MTEILRNPVKDASAWRGSDFAADDSWIHPLTTSELAEIDNALNGLRRRGLSVPDYGQAEFPLPTLAARIRAAVAEVEDGRGFALLRGLPVEKYDIDDLRRIYWGIGSYFGDPISQNSKGQILADVVDLGNDYSDINARGYKTRAELQPHVDTSDMVALFCVQEARSGGESMLASSITIHNEILMRYPEYLPVLYRGFNQDLRGEGITAKLDEVTFHEIPVFSYFEGRLSCCFNSKIIRSARVKMDHPLSTLEEEAIDCVIETAKQSDICLRMHLRPGDIQLVNNYTTLHWRSGYTDWPDEARKRRLMRFWVNSFDGRLLAPEFADRYNTGPRGGVAMGDGARYTF